MGNSFSENNEDKIFGFINDPRKCLEYINDSNNFQPFDEGLTCLICKYGYKGAKNDNIAKADFILAKLASIDATISKSTVKDWFNEKQRKSDHRENMFKICFALSASLSDIKVFFEHVYFDRDIYCHDIKEAVYFYCFKNHLSYAHALQLIETIHTYPDNASKDVTRRMPTITAREYSNTKTKNIKEQLEDFTSDNELLNYFRLNKSTFDHWNKTASNYIKTLFFVIKARDSDKDIVKKVETGKKITEKELKSCGLVIRVYLHVKYLLSHDDPNYYDIEVSTTNNTITSRNFMLKVILGTEDGVHRKSELTKIAKENFPRKHDFSKIIMNPTIASYDSIRKCLILLKFFYYCAFKLLNFESTDYDEYREETNAALGECGYTDLCGDNPYDLIFLSAILSDNPLGYLREFMRLLEP